MCYIYKEYSIRVYTTIIMQKVRGYVVFIRIKRTIQVFSRRPARVRHLSVTCQPIGRHVSANRPARASTSAGVRRTMTEALNAAVLHVFERLLPRLVLLIFAEGTVPAHICIDGLVKAEHLRDHLRSYLERAVG